MRAGDMDDIENWERIEERLEIGLLDRLRAIEARAQLLQEIQEQTCIISTFLNTKLRAYIYTD